MCREAAASLLIDLVERNFATFSKLILIILFEDLCDRN